MSEILEDSLGLIRAPKVGKYLTIMIARQALGGKKPAGVLGSKVIRNSNFLVDVASMVQMHETTGLRIMPGGPDERGGARR